MHDLYLGAAANFAISLLAFFVALRAGRKLKSTASFAITIVLLIAAMAVYYIFLRDRLFWARAIPFQGDVTLTDAISPLAGALAGVLCAPRPGRKAASPILIFSIVLIALTNLFRTSTGQWALTSQLKMEWKNGVCPQTSDDTTSAASAATLLGAHGIAANEFLMANACLSQSGGTPILGVYRGLRRITAGKPFRVVVLTGGNLDRLRQIIGTDGPVLISVGAPLFQSPPEGARYQNWLPGARHMVVLFGFRPDGKLDIGDPAVGRAEWDPAELDVIWNGEGLYLSRI